MDFIDDIFDLLPVCIYWKDLNGIYLGCNKHMVGVVGLDNKLEVIGKTDQEIVWHGSEISLKKSCYYVVTEKYVCSFHKKISESTQSNESFLNLKYPLSDKTDVIVGTIGICVDLGSALEDMMDESLVRSLQQVKHDIKSPLSAMVAVADMIKRATTDTKILELSGYLCDASNNLEDFINSLCRLCGSEDLKNKNTFFDLHILIKKVLDLSLVFAFSKDLFVEYLPLNDEPLTIFSDQDKVFRILMEIITNSIKYTSAGKVIIKTSFNLEDFHKWAVITISDTGFGMSDEAISRLTNFEVSNLEYESLIRGKGFGIGMIKNLAKSIGMKIAVNTLIDQGTEIKLSVKV